MSEPYLGQVQMFGFTFNPRGWANCDGQLLSINQNQALFSLYGTTYGGDGRTTFGLPDLRGRVPIHTGQGPGLPDFRLGTKSGQPDVILNQTQIPAHAHNFQVPCNSGDAASDEPVNNFLAKPSGGEQIYAGSGGSKMGAGTTENAGGNQAHTNMQPYLTIRFCCALVGIYPSRS